MRISSRGKYALASLIYIALHGNSEKNITVVSISKELGISKKYLEQIFALLKKKKILYSVKGGAGGYRFSKSADKISAADILALTETGLFEEGDSRLSPDASEIESVVRSEVMQKLSNSVNNSLNCVTIESLANAVKALKEQNVKDCCQL